MFNERITIGNPFQSYSFHFSANLTNLKNFHQFYLAEFQQLCKSHNKFSWLNFSWYANRALGRTSIPYLVCHTTIKGTEAQFGEGGDTILQYSDYFEGH